MDRLPGARDDVSLNTAPLLLYGPLQNLYIAMKFLIGGPAAPICIEANNPEYITMPINVNRITQVSAHIAVKINENASIFRSI